MKELSIEEKAKAYDEALNVLHKYDGAHIMFTQDLKEEMFPELKESEDERMELLNYLYDVHDDDEERARWIAWLEKQGEQKLIDKIQLGKMYKCIASPRYSTFVKGLRYVPQDKFLCSLMNFCSDCFEPIEDGEQKPTDKVEPKFHEGEWVVTDKNNVVQIKAIENGKYVLENTMRFSVDYVDKCWRKWTIQDAKDGDVLADDYGIYIFDRFDEEDEKCFLCMGAYQYSQKVYENEHMLCSVEVHPATKEQRDQLEKAMADAGYTFDFEKKELKKIEQKPAEEIISNPDYISPKDKALFKIATVLSQHEDKNGSPLEEIRSILVDYGINNLEANEQKPIIEMKSPEESLGISSEEYNKIVDECIYGEQKPVEWSEEDERHINSLIIMLEADEELMLARDYYKTLKEWLKSLKERVQPKQEWNEKDKCMLNNVIDTLKPLSQTTHSGYAINSMINWLKSLRPQNTWKPSEEQISVLSRSLKYIYPISRNYCHVLEELRAQLKKLRDE